MWWWFWTALIRMHAWSYISQPISPAVKVHVLYIAMHLCCLDTNRAKQWIIIGDENGHVGFWDYQTQRKVDALKVSASLGMISDFSYYFYYYFQRADFS